MFSMEKKMRMRLLPFGRGVRGEVGVVGHQGQVVGVFGVFLGGDANAVAAV
ncbi:hypothetical protein Fmac_000500 [Flemingia macrophylla]|uniref:Uncharacterized protein n=1 Tax=Flemingia macrophylla TaxID=520843 RepID=A0ABD1NEG1_9FABA